MTITVKIGDIQVVYALKLTRAPREYDGFGTFTLQTGWPENRRLVCVREEHLGWQTARNASGGFGMHDLPEGFNESLVTDALWARLWRGDERTIAPVA
jgi:hypothetical protein